MTTIRDTAKTSATLAVVFFVVLVLNSVTLPAQVTPADPKPDFTGVWTWNMKTAEHPVQTLSKQAANLPFTEAIRPRIDEYRAMEALSRENPGSYCVGFGMPGAMVFSGGYPMEIVQRPEQITILFEAHSEVRRIFMEPHPYKAEDEWSSLIGFSSGHWEGDTLVVTTKQLKEQIAARFPHSAGAVLVERYRLIGDEHGRRLVNDWTLADPAFYTEPITRQRDWRPLGNNGHLQEYACMEDRWQERESYLLERYRGGDPVVANPESDKTTE